MTAESSASLKVGGRGQNCGLLCARLLRCLWAATIVKPVALHTALYLRMLSDVSGWLLILSEMVLTHQLLDTKENLTLPKRVGESLPDNCRGQSPTSGPTCGNAFVTYLPEKGASVIQPMSQGAIQRFKRGQLSIFHSQMSELWLQCMQISGSLWS